MLSILLRLGQALPGERVRFVWAPAVRAAVEAAVPGLVSQGFVAAYERLGAESVLVRGSAPLPVHEARVVRGAGVVPLAQAAREAFNDRLIAALLVAEAGDPIDIEYPCADGEAMRARLVNLVNLGAASALSYNPHTQWFTLQRGAAFYSARELRIVITQ